MHPLTKKWDHFAESGPLFMFLSVLESRGVGATFAFEIIQKYVRTKKWEQKIFWVTFFITRFEQNIFFEKKSKMFRKKLI